MFFDNSQDRSRVQEDLRGILQGEVRCDDVFLQLYASDASIYEVKPLGVVRPRNLDDVVACLEYASENQISIHPRGAGTGLAGESLGTGLIIDFSFHMRRLLDFDSTTARVQPGLVHAQLNRQLRSHGRMYAPDPATRSVTTMGSVLSLDGSGSHWLQYGSARDHIESMQVVLSNGHVVELGKHEIGPPPTHDEFDAVENDLVRTVSNRIEHHQQQIEAARPQTMVNRAGYHVWDVVQDGKLDLAKLFVGSEGTLGLITEAVVKTVPIPEQRGVAIFFFDRLENAAKGAAEVRQMNVAACDLMDRRLLSIARESDVRFELLIPAQAEAMLLVEVQSHDAADLRERLRLLVQRIQRRKRLAFDSKTTMEQDQRDLFWRLARRVIPTLYRLKGNTRALPFVEDIAIPPKHLPKFLVDLQNVFKQHQVTASVFSHAGHGQMHIRPFMDLANADDIRKIQGLAIDLYERVVDLGGTISGEHGVGLSRTWYVQKQFGPLYELFREIKKAFDPLNLLNPHKVVTDSPQPMTKNLRPVTVPEVDPASDLANRPPIQLLAVWKEEDIAYAARACNGCGRCRTSAPDERMCPIFRYAPREEASPRAKANLMRAVLTGRLPVTELSGDSLKQIADLCVNCHQCRQECPASVDIPKLMMECKAQHVANNGLRPSDWFLARLDFWSAYGSLLHTFTNWALNNRQMRWLFEKFTGIAQGRKLPRLAPRSFLRIAQRRRLTRPTRRTGQKVLFFVDTYANWFDVALAEALVAILEHNGITVYVPQKQLGSGMPLISLGALDQAKKIATQNVRILADAIRQGYHIVTTEPAAALCLQHEYANLLDDDDTRLVAENSSEACAFLWRLHQLGKLELDFRPLAATLRYHLPCHIKAMQVGTPGLNLLKLIPGISVHHDEHGCSGMAGTFGLKRENYRASLRAGWDLISAVREPTIQAGTTECCSCKMQMEQGTNKPTIHPIKLLALAYGIAPELNHILTQQSGDLTVS